MSRGLLIFLAALLPLRGADGLDAALGALPAGPNVLPLRAFELTRGGMVEKLAEACQNLELIYWAQSDLKRSPSTTPRPTPDCAALLMINGSRFDLVDENKPFAASEPVSPGRSLYPKGLTRERIEQYVKDHPEKKAEIYNPYTVIRWRGNDLVGIPYHEVYKRELDRAAASLRDGAALSPDPAFASFFAIARGRVADDNYYASDLAWLDLKDPKIDLIFAPYEPISTICWA